MEKHAYGLLKPTVVYELMYSFSWKKLFRILNTSLLAIAWLPAQVQKSLDGNKDSYIGSTIDIID